MLEYIDIPAIKNGMLAGPKTVIYLFSYGGVFPVTSRCLQRDLAYFSWHNGFLNGMSRCVDLAWQLGADIGIPGSVPSGWEILLADAPQDADVGRGRSCAARDFLKTDAEVMIMIDRDHDWVAPGPDYEGDLLRIARSAAKTKSVVGACVSKKADKQGIASMWKNGGVKYPFTDSLEEAETVGGAFTAYHRDVIQAVSDSLIEVVPGFKPVFMQLVSRHPLNPAADHIHHSEDWAFTHRARRLGYKMWLDMKPDVGHYGNRRWGMMDSQPDEPRPVGPQMSSSTNAEHNCIPVESSTLAPAYSQTQEQTVTISLIHATRGRPKQAELVKDKWHSTWSNTHGYEYIYSTDEDDIGSNYLGGIVGKNRGNVDAYNRGVYVSRGRVLVQVHDDVDPPQGWDRLIVDAIGDLDRPVLLRIDDGNGDRVNPDKPWLIPVQVCTRAWTKKLGGMFYPEYVSVFCDDDAALKAEQDGCVVEAKHILFKHNFQGAERDETQRRSYASENWISGSKLLARRKAAGFPDAQEVASA